MKNIDDDVAVFWDHENCPAPTNTSGYAIVNNIRSVIQDFGSVKLFRAYLEVTGHVPVSRATVLRSELQSSGVSLTDCPHNGKKIVSDKMIIVDMLAYAIDNPAPSTIVLISGDRDFAYALSILRLRRYRIVLITLSNAHPSLRAQASVCFDWVSNVLEPPVDPAWSRQPIYPRGGKKSSPLGHDKPSLEFNGHDSRFPFRGSYDEKSAKPVDFMDYFQDATRRRESSCISPRHDFLPPDLERSKSQPAVYSVASTTSHHESEPPARGVYSPVTSSCYTYINDSIKTPLTMTARDSNSSRTTPTPSTSAGKTPQHATDEGIMPSRSCVHSTVGGSHLSNLAQHKVASVTEPVPLEPAIKLLPAEPHSSSQQGTYSLINAKTQSLLSSVDKSDNGDGDPPSHHISQPPKVIDPLSASAPSFILPSSLNNATVSATVESLVKVANPRQPTFFPVVPDRFKILIQCLKFHRHRGSLRPLRSLIGLEIAQNGATYRQAGVLKFGEYVMMAEKAGIVELGGFDGTSWIALKAPWYNLP